MSSQPTNNLNSTTQETSPDLSCPVATDAKDAEKQSRTTALHEKLGPELMSLIFELRVYPPGWEKEWNAKLSQQPWDKKPKDRDRYPRGDFNSPRVRFRLMETCREWENIALSTPELWNKHFIVINAKDEAMIASSRVNHTLNCLKYLSQKSLLTLYMAFYQNDGVDESAIGAYVTYQDFMIEIIDPKYTKKWSHLFLRDCEGPFKIWNRNSTFAPPFTKLKFPKLKSICPRSPPAGPPYSMFYHPSWNEDPENPWRKTN